MSVCSWRKHGQFLCKKLIMFNTCLAWAARCSCELLSIWIIHLLSIAILPQIFLFAPPDKTWQQWVGQWDKQEKRTEKCQVVCFEIGEFKVHVWLLFLHYACIHKLFGKNGSNCVMVKAYHQGQISNQNYFCFYLHMMPIALLETHLKSK